MRTRTFLLDSLPLVCRQASLSHPLPPSVVVLVVFRHVFAVLNVEQQRLFSSITYQESINQHHPLEKYKEIDTELVNRMLFASSTHHQKRLSPSSLFSDH